VASGWSRAFTVMPYSGPLRAPDDRYGELFHPRIGAVLVTRAGRVPSPPLELGAHAPKMLGICGTPGRGLDPDEVLPEVYAHRAALKSASPCFRSITNARSGDSGIP
jgi:hypothetical protein